MLKCIWTTRYQIIKYYQGFNDTEIALEKNSTLMQIVAMVIAWTHFVIFKIIYFKNMWILLTFLKNLDYNRFTKSKQTNKQKTLALFPSFNMFLFHINHLGIDLPLQWSLILTNMKTTWNGRKDLCIAWGIGLNHFMSLWKPRLYDYIYII